MLPQVPYGNGGFEGYHVKQYTINFIGDYEFQHEGAFAWQFWNTQDQVTGASMLVDDLPIVPNLISTAHLAFNGSPWAPSYDSTQITWGAGTQQGQLIYWKMVKLPDSSEEMMQND